MAFSLKELDAMRERYHGDTVGAIDVFHHIYAPTREIENASAPHHLYLALGPYLQHQFITVDPIPYASPGD